MIWLWGAVLACVVATAAPAIAQQPATCSKSDFETVVDEAAAALRGLNQQNTPSFQGKLRNLDCAERRIFSWF